MYPVRTGIMLFLFGMALCAAGCGLKQDDKGEAAQASEEKVTCIGVLPAATAPVPPGTAGEEKAKILSQGAALMDKLLQQELQAHEGFRIVGHDFLAGLSLTGGESPLVLARLVGQRIGCNAVLETEVSRFNERVGGKYSVEKPAAVAFDFRLIAIDSGAVLWSATFDEAQKAVTENIYDWKKASSRGFSWVTAEGLMLEGVRLKFGNNPYFKDTQQKDETGKSAPASGQR